MKTPTTRLNRARAIAAVATATLALGLAACGGSDDAAGTSTDTGADAATSVNAGDFIIQLEEEKQATIESVVAANPECDGVDTDRDFLLLVTAQAMDLKPSEPVEPLIVDNCTP